MTDVTMAKLSDLMEEGTILSWLKTDGDTVVAKEEGTTLYPSAL